MDWNSDYCSRDSLYMMFIGKYMLPKVELSADQEIEQEVES